MNTYIDTDISTQKSLLVSSCFCLAQLCFLTISSDGEYSPQFPKQSVFPADTNDIWYSNCAISSSQSSPWSTTFWMPLNRPKSTAFKVRTEFPSCCLFPKPLQTRDLHKIYTISQNHCSKCSGPKCKFYSISSKCFFLSLSANRSVGINCQYQSESTTNSPILSSNLPTIACLDSPST